MYHFTPTYENDTHTAVRFTLQDQDNLPIDLTGSTITMRISREGYTEAIKTLSIGTGLSMGNESHTFLFDKQKLNLPAGNYSYQIQIQFPGDGDYTYITGKLPIMPSIKP